MFTHLLTGSLGQHGQQHGQQQQGGPAHGILIPWFFITN